MYMNCARHQKERQVLVLGTFVNATAVKLGGAAQAAVRARSVIDILRADFTTLLDINDLCHNRALSFFATSSIDAKAIIHLPSQQPKLPRISHQNSKRIQRGCGVLWPPSRSVSKDSNYLAAPPRGAC
jgi:hypothetical protein